MNAYEGMFVFKYKTAVLKVRVAGAIMSSWCVSGNTYCETTYFLDIHRCVSTSISVNVLKSLSESAYGDALTVLSLLTIAHHHPTHSDSCSHNTLAPLT